MELEKVTIKSKDCVVLVDGCFSEVSKNAQRFMIVNEIGRRQEDSERKADAYTRQRIGEYATYIAMYELIHYYLKRDIDKAARYMIRLADLGYKTSMFKIESSDGSASLGVGELRALLNAKKAI